MRTATRRRSWPLVCALALAACGGGGGSGGGSSIGGGDKQASSLDPIGRPLTAAEQQHFLIRTGFGASAAEMAEFRALGLDAWIDKMLTFERGSQVELRALNQIESIERPKDWELVYWWLFLMTRTENPFQEALALFWHDHFATSQRVLESSGRWFFYEHVQMLRTLGAGNLRELLYGVIEDPAVLVWLDGVDNERSHPNENLSREFWELFTLGRDKGYTRQDIAESSRALTGYRLVEDRDTRRWFIVFDEAKHDAGVKTIFGQSGNWRARDVVDLSMAHRDVAGHVCRSLLSHFCYADPSDELVAELSRLLVAGGWELKPVLRKMLRSKAFFSYSAMQGRIKSPIELVVGFVRTTGLSMRLGDLDDALAGLSQQPTNPPSVGGWPIETSWLSSHAMLERGNTINEILSARSFQSDLGVGVQELLPPPAERTAEAVLEQLAGLLRVKLAPAERTIYLEYLNTAAESDEDGDLVLESSPFDGSDSRHIDERVRGILFLLAQHPSYQLR